MNAKTDHQVISCSEPTRTLVVGECQEKHLIHEYGESIIDKFRMKKSILYDKKDIDTKDMIKHYKKEIKRLRKEKGL